MPGRKVDPMLRELIAQLDATKLPYEVLLGGRHRKIRLNGALVATVPYGNGSGAVNSRGMKNAVANIKRAARASKP